MVRLDIVEDFIAEKMAQELQAYTAPRGSWPSRNAQFLLGSVVICLLVGAVYYQVLGKLVTDWWRIPDYSHGFLVPLFAAYLVWDKRKTLLNTKITPTWKGVVVVAAG